MVVLEGLVLLVVGLLFGIAATVFDVMFVGSAAFLSHFALWVLVNALLAVHVESRAKAIWWAVPFNLGFIEAYYITTAASYEGFAKSLVVPLAAVALVSPLLTYALWTARDQSKNAYGKALTAFIVVGTLAASYVIDGAFSIFDFVASVLVALVVLVMPTRRIKISPSTRAASEQPEVAPVPGLEADDPVASKDEGASAEAKRANADERPKRVERTKRTERTKGKEKPKLAERIKGTARAKGKEKSRLTERTNTEDKPKRTERVERTKTSPTRRQGTRRARGTDNALQSESLAKEMTPRRLRRRRSDEREERVNRNPERERRRDAGTQRRARREDERASRPADRVNRSADRASRSASPDASSNVAFLGTARTARRSSRSRSQED